MADRQVESATVRNQRYVVERYAPELTLERMRAGEARARSAAASVSRSGRPVRYVGSIVMETEQTIFSVFEADSPDAIEDVNRRAGLPFDRIVPVVELRESERPALVAPSPGWRRSPARVPRASVFAGGAAPRKGSNEP